MLEKYFSYMKVFNEVINGLIEKYYIKSLPKTGSEMIKCLDEVGDNILNDPDGYEYILPEIIKPIAREAFIEEGEELTVDFIKDYEKSKTFELSKFIEKLMNPKLNGFKLLNTKQQHLLRYHNEVWTSGDCLLVDFYNFKEFKEKVLSQI
jgi:hypothetical protein